MRALKVLSPGRAEVVGTEGEVLSPGDVRVDVGAVGLCGTDFALVAGDLGLNSYPVVIGHEVAGTVSASRSPLIDEGDRVVLDPVRSCGQCWACARGAPQLCERVGVIGVAWDGGCRDGVVLPGRQWVRLPSELLLRDAVLIEPVHVGARVYNEVVAASPETVMVVGAGPIGLILVLLLRYWRPGTEVVVFDIVPERARHAEALGALAFVEGEGERFDCVVDGVGSQASMRLCAEGVRRGGTIVVYGVPKRGVGLPDVDKLFRKNVRVVFSRLYGRDFSLATAVVLEGVVTAAKLVGTTMDMESAAGFLSSRGWESASHWGKAVVLIGAQ